MQDELFIEVDIFLSIPQLTEIDQSIIIEECHRTSYVLYDTIVIPATAVEQPCPQPIMLMLLRNGSLINIVSTTVLSLIYSKSILVGLSNAVSNKITFKWTPSFYVPYHAFY